ncbi:MAG: hypothetical protein ACE5ED_13320, partial [Rhodothalassiaceae bacterium]
PVRRAGDGDAYRIEGEDAAAIQEKTAALSQAALKLGEAIYKSQSEAGAGETAGASAAEEKTGAGEEDVVDVDFEEVDDDKKS